MEVPVPVMPNAPLENPWDEDRYGRLALRRQKETGFVENVAFDPRLLTYDSRYQNSQAYSTAFRSHMRAVCEMLLRRYRSDIRVVEIGCGKGDFIEFLEQQGFSDVRGFDAAYEGSHPNIESRYVEAHDRIQADLVVLRHVLEHVRRPHKFLGLLAEVFGPTCHVYVEVPCLDWILDRHAYFDVTYEHVNYFTSRSLSALFGDAVLESGPLFERQYIYAISQLGAPANGSFDRAYEGADWEPLEFFSLFPRVERQIQDICARLKAGRKAYVWGAATKGCLFLHYLTNLGGRDRVPFVVDINPHKIGRFLPGTKIPIASKESFFQHASVHDLLIVTNPNYLAEITAELLTTRLAGIETVCI